MTVVKSNELIVVIAVGENKINYIVGIDSQSINQNVVTIKGNVIELLFHLHHVFFSFRNHEIL